MRNLSLLVPDGVGIRNFILGPFLRTATATGPKNARVHVLHGIPPDILPAYTSKLGGNVHWHPLISYPDRPLPLIQRNCLIYAQTFWVDTYAMRITRNRSVGGSWRTRAAMRFAKFVGRTAASPRGIQFLDRWHCSVVSRLPEVDHYRRLFGEIKPSVLFCSHQRPPIILPPVLAAKSLGIPTATFIFSWDNLTSKGRIAAPFDHYLVWSNLMKQELLRYYPDVSERRVHVVGTPQFDPYADSSLSWSRKDFFALIGADPHRPLICYSGGDAGNAPRDPKHVAVLLDLIRSGQIRRNPQVLLRPMPVDDGKRFDELRASYPELIYARPDWAHTSAGDHASVMPMSDDVQFLANLTQHADLNINFGSTMTLDFGLRDKPVINIAFDAGEPLYGIPLWEYQCQFEHYRPVIDFGAARFARSAEELALHVNTYLDDPALDREGRRKLVDLQVGVPLGKSTQRIIETLDRIAGTRQVNGQAKFSSAASF